MNCLTDCNSRVMECRIPKDDFLFCILYLLCLNKCSKILWRLNSIFLVEYLRLERVFENHINTCDWVCLGSEAPNVIILGLRSGAFYLFAMLKQRNARRFFGVKTKFFFLAKYLCLQGAFVSIWISVTEFVCAVNTWIIMEKPMKHSRFC